MSDYLLALSPLIGLALNSLSLVMIYRSRPALGLLRSEYLCFAIGALAVVAVNLFLMYIDPERQLQNIIGHGLLTFFSYSALGYCHFHFVNLGETARRIRLQREIYRAGGSLSHNELLLRYNAREIVDKRISRLIHSGQIIANDGRYFIGNRTVVMIAQFIVGLKVLLLGKNSEHCHKPR